MKFQLHFNHFFTIWLQFFIICLLFFWNTYKCSLYTDKLTILRWRQHKKKSFYFFFLSLACFLKPTLKSEIPTYYFSQKRPITIFNNQCFSFARVFNHKKKKTEKNKKSKREMYFANEIFNPTFSSVVRSHLNSS